MTASPSLSKQPVAADPNRLSQDRSKVIASEAKQPVNNANQVVPQAENLSRVIARSEATKPEQAAALEKQSQEDPERTEPKNDGEKLSIKLYKIIKGLTSKMGFFSLFEMTMAGIGSVLSKGSPYWLSYFGASFVEWVENKATSEEDYQMPKPITALFNSLCRVWGVKDKQGESLTWDRALIEGCREKIVGAFNASLSIFTFVYSVAKPLLAMAGIGNKKHEEPSAVMKKVNFFAKAILPTINAWLMWSSSAGKALLGHTLALLPHPPKVKVQRANGKEELEPLDVSGHLQSAIEDLICGGESTGLMIGHLIEKINPTLGRIYDTCLGILISLSSFNNGRNGMRGEEREDARPLAQRYPLRFLHKGTFGQFFYSSVQAICKAMGLKLPELSDLHTIIQKNNPLQQAAFSQKLNGDHAAIA